MPPLGARRILVRRPATYTQRVRALSPIAYWPLADPSGTVATDASGNGRNGTYSGVTLGVPGIGDGRTAASFNGTSSFCNVYSTSLRDAFGTAEGSIAVWFKVSGSGVWTDGAVRRIVSFQVDAGNRAYMEKPSGSNVLTLNYNAGSTNKTITKTSFSATGWTHICMTWSKSADRFAAYINGVIEPTQTGLGTWAGTLLSTNCNIGANATTPTSLWSGNLAHVAVFNRPLTANEIFALSSVS